MNFLNSSPPCVICSSESRAFASQARSLELFDRMGIADEFLAQGVVNPGVEFYVGKRHLGGLNFDKAASPDTVRRTRPFQGTKLCLT